MKQEAEKVFFFSNYFKFNQDHLSTLVFLSCICPQVLRSICCIHFMFIDEHIESWKNRTRDQWQISMEFVSQNFDIINLCLIVNTEANYDLCLWCKDEADNRYVYDAYCEIVQQLLVLYSLRDLHLEFPWFCGLKNILEYQIIGEHYNSRKGNKYTKVEYKLGDWDLLSWHNIIPCVKSMPVT